MSTLKRFFRDTIIYGIAAVLPRAINIVLVKLHTHTLISSSYADSTIYFVYAAYLNALLTYGMETAFFRFFTGEKEKGKVISTAFLTLLGTTLAFMSLALFYSNELSVHMGFTSPLALQILILVTTFDTLLVIPFAYLRVTNRPIKFTFYKVLNVVIFAIFNLYFLLYVPNALEYGNYVPGFLADRFYEQPLVLYIFMANLLGSVITFLLLFPLVFKFKLNYDRALLYKMLGYGLPIMISGLAYVTNENLDKLLLTRYLGKEQMGIYAACYKLGVFMSLYIMAFKMGAEPFFFNQAEKSDAKITYSRIMNWFVVFGSLFMVIIVCFIDLFAQLLLGRSVYFSALEIVPVILLANLFLGIYYNLSVWFKLTDRTRYGMFFSVLGAALTIGLNVVFIPKYGYMASAWATLATYILVALLSYLYGRKYYRIPYNLSINFFSLISAAAGSFISFYYFRANYLASVAIVLIFLTGIILTQKTEIKKIWKT